MLTIYSIGIAIYGWALKVASLFNVKAKLWVEGRQDTLQALSELDHSCSWIWIHAASLGEFEQGRHLIERIKQQYPNYKIALSFFSPSGYEARKNYRYADHVFYMPLDTKINAVSSIQALRPALAIFIKYDFWWNHLKALQEQEIPIIYLSATFRPDQYFVKWKLSKFINILKNVRFFYLQDEPSAKVLDNIAIQQYAIVGDTRLDTILSDEPNNQQKAEIEQLKASIKSRKCIIYGSVHKEDLELVKQSVSKYEDVFHLIFPHELDEISMRTWEEAIKNYDNTLIYSKMGVLKHSYTLSDIVYIGGGFGSGIHNTLEPLKHLKPIIIGPKYQKFPEAIDLIQKGGIIDIATINEFTSVVSDLLDKSRQSISLAQSQYIEMSKGATDKVLSSLKEYILTK